MFHDLEGLALKVVPERAHVFQVPAHAFLLELPGQMEQIVAVFSIQAGGNEVVGLRAADGVESLGVPEFFHGVGHPPGACGIEVAQTRVAHDVRDFRRGLKRRPLQVVHVHVLGNSREAIVVFAVIVEAVVVLVAREHVGATLLDVRPERLQRRKVAGPEIIAVDVEYPFRRVVAGIPVRISLDGLVTGPRRAVIGRRAAGGHAHRSKIVPDGPVGRLNVGKYLEIPRLGLRQEDQLADRGMELLVIGPHQGRKQSPSFIAAYPFLKKTPL